MQQETTDHLLDEGVVSGIHAGAKGIETLAVAVIRRVSSGSQNPVLITAAETELINPQQVPCHSTHTLSLK